MQNDKTIIEKVLSTKLADEGSADIHVGEFVHSISYLFLAQSSTNGYQLLLILS